MALGTSRLALPFQRSKPADSIYEQIDFRLCQFLAKGRHPGFAVGYYRSERSGAGKTGILFPPFSVREIRGLEQMPGRSVAATVSAVAAGAISIEQFTHLHTARTLSFQGAAGDSGWKQ